MRIRLEHAPIPESRITLAKELDSLGLPRVDLHLVYGELEAKTLEEVANAFAHEVGRAGFARLCIPPGIRNWHEKAGWQVHHMGGTRMSADPKLGVVDQNCKVHGLANLFVAGSSVFPTSGHANPTMNLVALTLRLADHLRVLP